MTILDCGRGDILERGFKRRLKRTGAGLLFAAACSLTSSPAYAYLDPGSGGLLLQLLLGGVAGMVVIMKLYWHRFLVLIGRKEPVVSEDENGPVKNGPDENTPDQP